MPQTAIEYVQKVAEGGWRVADSRVSLDSIVHAYWEGKSPEAIADAFPTLMVEQVYGAIAFYLRYQAEVDEYLAQQVETWQKLAATSELQHAALLNRIGSQRKSNSTESAQK